MISSPSKKIRPASIGSSRLTQRSSVLFPLPLGPMIDEDLARRDLEVDAVEHEVVAEALPNAFEADDRVRPPVGGPGGDVLGDAHAGISRALI